MTGRRAYVWDMNVEIKLVRERHPTRFRDGAIKFETTNNRGVL